MNQSKINVRYAKAFFSLARDAGEMTALHDDMKKVYALCRDSEDFMQLLHNPVVNVSQKKQILKDLLKPHVHEMTLRFILLIAENNRETELPGICRNFTEMVRRNKGIIPATVTTAVEMSPGILDQIRRILEQETGKTVELSGRVNSAILGGMILRIDDLQFDGSISTQLKKIKTAMLAK